MNKLLINLVIVAIAAAVCCATPPPVKQCQKQNYEGLENRIKIDPCSPKKCKLPREANITVAFQFMPTKEVKSLKNDVYAQIAGLRLPFIGTTDTSACGEIRRADTDEPAPCPLQAGIEYVYKNVFYIYPLYPIVDQLLVHWSLYDGKQQVICFEVPAAIVNRKTKKSQ